MTFQELIDKWPHESGSSGRVGLARDLGVSTERVRKWHERDAIAKDYFPAIVAKAREHGLRDSKGRAITLEGLFAMRAGDRFPVSLNRVA